MLIGGPQGMRPHALNRKVSAGYPWFLIPVSFALVDSASMRSRPGLVRNRENQPRALDPVAKTIDIRLILTREPFGAFFPVGGEATPTPRATKQWFAR